MKSNILYIKNMVCSYCILEVKGILNKLNINVDKIHIGEVITSVSKEMIDLKKLKRKLHAIGLDLLEENKM